ncbi:MAG TPA: PilZ domain-containing protein [Kofleriaceae bacterium]|jgi:c-di-GMP-binding flagellar brake protein YcgR|nr:PilZ domain-containing protein [Kofleriaceae bacterium]
MRDRRLGYRIPFTTLLTSFVNDRPMRALAEDISDTGMRLHAVTPLAPAPGTQMAIELSIPGTDDTIWARAEVCYRKGDDLAAGLGIRFTAMAQLHARLLREYCVESRRSHLGGLLGRIRGAA